MVRTHDMTCVSINSPTVLSASMIFIMTTPNFYIAVNAMQFPSTSLTSRYPVSQRRRGRQILQQIYPYLDPSKTSFTKHTSSISAKSILATKAGHLHGVKACETWTGCSLLTIASPLRAQPASTVPFCTILATLQQEIVRFKDSIIDWYLFQKAWWWFLNRVGACTDVGLGYHQNSNWWHLFRIVCPFQVESATLHLRG